MLRRRLAKTINRCGASCNCTNVVPLADYCTRTFPEPPKRKLMTSPILCRLASTMMKLFLADHKHSKQREPHSCTGFAKTPAHIPFRTASQVSPLSRSLDQTSCPAHHYLRRFLIRVPSRPFAVSGLIPRLSPGSHLLFSVESGC